MRDLVDKCYDIISCNTATEARKIIDSIPKNELKKVALFLYMQYSDLKRYTIEIKKEVEE